MVFWSLVWAMCLSLVLSVCFYNTKLRWCCLPFQFEKHQWCCLFNNWVGALIDIHKIFHFKFFKHGIRWVRKSLVHFIDPYNTVNTPSYLKTTLQCLIPSMFSTSLLLFLVSLLLISDVCNSILRSNWNTANWFWLCC